MTTYVLSTKEEKKKKKNMFSHIANFESWTNIKGAFPNKELDATQF